MFYKETEFQETPIGKIPKDWETTKLSELSEHITKGTTPTTYGFGYTASGIHFIKVESIDDRGAFVPENIPHISEEANEVFSRSILRENDILFSIAGALGRVATVTGEILPANVNQALAIIRLKEQNRLSVKYLKYFLMGSQIQNFVRTIAIQSQQANINLEHVRNFTVALPPLGEQRGIVEVLGVVDLAVGKTGEVIAKTERLKKGLMQELLTKGIGHKEYKYSKELAHEIPQDWDVLHAEKICDRVTDGTHDTPKPVENGYYLVTSKHIKNGIIDFSEAYFISEEDFIEVNKRSKVDYGDVLFSMIGTVGMTTIVRKEYPTFAIKNIGLFKTNNDFSLAYWLNYYFQSPITQKYIKDHLKGTTQKYIPLHSLRTFPIALPSPIERGKIAEILSTVDRKLELERTEKIRLERVKRGLMDLLLTGKVRVKVD